VKRVAVFLDRDGVINQDTGYVSQIDDFQFIDGVIDALKELKQHDLLLVVVTNQSGIGRGYFSEAQFLQLTEWMDWSLADRGVDLDGIYYCPHHAEQGIGEYKVACDCRKPAAGMFLQAVKDLDIDLTHSFMVGDKAADMDAAINADIPCRILVETGKPITAEGRSKATVVLPSLVEACKWILDHKG